MIDLWRLGLFVRRSGWKFGALDQCAAADRAPVGLGLGVELGVAVSADSFHASRLMDGRRVRHEEMNGEPN